MTPATLQDSPTMSASSPTPPGPILPGENVARHWLLDPSLDFLNHGSFGATPRIVLESQARWRERIETRPVEMIARRAPEYLAEAKEAIGAFLGMRPRDFGFTSNATDGVNAVTRSLKLSPGDEIVFTNHVYRAVRKTLMHVASDRGAALREVEIPLPVRSPRQVIDAVMGAITPRTKLLVLCHISSATAIVFPVAEIVAGLARTHPGVDVLIDGAHAAGVLDLDISSVNAAFYGGNLHKWTCGPKGSAFIWARPDRQSGVHPTVISHWYGEGFENEFTWQGTRDLSAWICTKDSIDFMAGLGWDRIRAHNHQMAVWVQHLLTRRWGVQPLSPPSGSMLGSMASVSLPESMKRFETVEKLQALLFERYRFEIPVIDFAGRWLVRPCCQVYNTPDQYERLGEVIADLAAIP